mmetsp:Transcript_32125/g.103702  ORF Transcript_32125/g.103702 Transcript_32125/m.103702 type:complete len:234 (-) Transcript_32125:739-1440(-)|eukprot:scaffold31815_cov118-Isochrysis_galbana.AAC.20
MRNSSASRCLQSPGAAQPRKLTPAKPTRCRLTTWSPSAEHMRRICRLRPSCSTNRSSRPRALPVRSTTHGLVGHVRGGARLPSRCATVVITTPDASSRTASSLGSRSTTTRYSFRFDSDDLSRRLTIPPSEVRRMRPVESASSLPTGKSRSAAPPPRASTLPSSSMIFPRCRRSVVLTTPRRFHIFTYVNTRDGTTSPAAAEQTAPPAGASPCAGRFSLSQSTRLPSNRTSSP